MAKGDVKILILGDATDAKKAFDDAAKHADKFNGGVKNGFTETGKHADQLGSKVSGVGKVLGGLGAMFAGGALFGFLNDSVQAASDLNETVSKANVVFGSAADSVMKMGETSASALGMSKNEAIGAAATYGNLFRAMGMAEDASADMSTKLVGLAGDLASFNNADPSEVLRALQSGLVGETEPLRTFGVSLSAARVEAEALRLGLVKGLKDTHDVETANIAVAKSHTAAAEAAKQHGYNSMEYRDAAAKMAQAEDNLAGKIKGKVPDLDAATKAQATYSLILQDTTLAQGDFARTSDGLANKTRIQKAEFENLKTEIGTKLLPVWLGAMSLMNQAADGVKKWWDDNGENLKKKFTDTFGEDPVKNFKEGLRKLGVQMDDTGRDADSLYANFERGSVMVYGAIGPKWEGFGQILHNLGETFDTVKNTIQGNTAAIGIALDRFTDPFKTLFNWASNALRVMRELGEWTSNPVNKALNIPGLGQGAEVKGARASGGPVSANDTYLVGENGPELFTPGMSGNITANGRFEDGSRYGMSPAEKAAQNYVESIQRQAAMRKDPSLAAKPGWGALAADPFANWGKPGPFDGWDPNADFSQWGKPAANPPRPAASRYDEPRQQGTTETINLILDGEVIASHIRRRELQIR